MSVPVGFPSSSVPNEGLGEVGSRQAECQATRSWVGTLEGALEQQEGLLPGCEGESLRRCGKVGVRQEVGPGPGPA